MGVILYLEFYMYNAHQVLDELLEMFFGGLCFLFPPDDDNKFRIIISRLLGEYHTCSKLVTHTTDIGTLTTNQETMILWLAADLQSVMFLRLKERRGVIIIN